jgi:hypothetical protein
MIVSNGILLTADNIRNCWQCLFVQYKSNSVIVLFVKLLNEKTALMDKSERSSAIVYV